MNKTPFRPACQTPLLIALAGACLVSGPDARAQNVQHLSATFPGGMPGQPIMTGIERGSNRVTVTWDGPAGYYQLYKRPSLTSGAWQAVGAPSLQRRATLPGSNGFFRVTGPTAQYGGHLACVECHGTLDQQVARTGHSRAFTGLKQIGQDKNPACLPCHTVGYKLPTGFVSESSTPHLAGVQCENCHGPAGNHAANENDPTVRPRVELAATVCGGCHSVPQSPAYPEWKTSGHAAVTPGALAAMKTSSANLSGCGRCHSASVRLSLLKGDALPTGDADVAITCAVCHNSHQATAYPAQLRNPLVSTNDYYLSPSASFSSKYNSKINLCAQCHNHAGAAWTDTAMAPHASPQYNILLGTVGELPSGARPSQPAAHGLDLAHQCVDCHMQTSPYHEGPPEVAAVTGHQFQVTSYNLCRDCHPLPEALVEFAQGSISAQIQRLKAGLDLWATTKAAAALQAKYGPRAWEYTIPGALSNPPGVTDPGPTAAEQALVPANIKKARFNLYLVFADGSFGVHNGPFAVTLLEAAEGWIQAELNQ